MARSAVNKRSSTRKFNRQAKKTHPLNVARPGRGGFRL